MKCDSLDEAAELAEDETIGIAYGFLEDTWRYKVVEIDKSYENQVAELKTWLKEYWQSCIENSDYPAITKVLEEIKSIRSLSEFDEIEASEYSEPIIILRKSIDKDYIFELEVKIGNAYDSQDHEFFKGDWHRGENFKYVKDLQANFKAIKYDLSDLDYLEDIQKVFIKLRDNVDDDIDTCLNRIYNQDGLTPIGFDFEPNAHADDWDEDDYYTSLIFEDIHESIYYY